MYYTARNMCTWRIIDKEQVRLIPTFPKSLGTCVCTNNLLPSRDAILSCTVGEFYW